MSEEHPVMGISLLALVEAGKISADDGVLAMMQGVDYKTSCSIAEWLVMATGGPVTLQWMTVGDVQQIRRTPADIEAKTKRVENQPPDVPR